MTCPKAAWLSNQKAQEPEIQEEKHMCIICVSPAKVRQPSMKTIRTMFERNPHGAGYMYARDGKVHISKGYINIDDFLSALHDEHFTAKDPVVYHFRISTQAGVNPQMTHPFPLSNQRAHMKALDVDCRCGVAHNGIIRLTTDPTNREYSDTAIFITDYLSAIIRRPDDLKDNGHRHGETEQKHHYVSLAPGTAVAKDLQKYEKRHKAIAE